MQNGYEWQQVSKRTYAEDLGGPTTTAPMAPLPSELRNLERSIARLDDMIGQLAGRIEPVCRVDPPQAVGTGAQEGRPRASSTIGVELGNYAERIDALSARVSGLLRRCEL